MATLPSPEEVSLPGRILFRSGVSAQIPGSALRLGEGAVTTDNWFGWLGDESQNPPHWPTSKSTGTWDSTNLDYTFYNLNTTKINGQFLKDLFESYITTGATPVLTIVNDNLTKTVYGPGADFADIGAAYAWLSQRTISTLGFVTLIFPAIQIIDSKRYYINHPNGDRIAWKGASLKAPLPGPSSFQLSGYTQVAIANDGVANLNLVRGYFATEIQFVNGGGLSFGQSNLSQISNMLISSDGTIGPYESANGIEITKGSVTFNNVCVAGFDRIGIFVSAGSIGMTAGSSLICFNNGGGGVSIVSNASFDATYGTTILLGNGGRHVNDYGTAGLIVNDNSIVTSYPYYTNTTPSIMDIRGNAGSGISLVNSTLASSGSFALTVQYNGSNGVDASSSSKYRVPGANISYNAGNGIGCVDLSEAQMPNSTVLNNGSFNIVAINFSFINRAGSNVSGAGNGVDYSPAPGQTGNTGSYMQ